MKPSFPGPTPALAEPAAVGWEEEVLVLCLYTLYPKAMALPTDIPRILEKRLRRASLPLESLGEGGW